MLPFLLALILSLSACVTVNVPECRPKEAVGVRGKDFADGYVTHPEIILKNNAIIPDNVEALPLVIENGHLVVPNTMKNSYGCLVNHGDKPCPGYP